MKQLKTVMMSPASVRIFTVSAKAGKNKTTESETLMFTGAACSLVLF